MSLDAQLDYFLDIHNEFMRYKKRLVEIDSMPKLNMSLQKAYEISKELTFIEQRSDVVFKELIPLATVILENKKKPQ